MANKKLFNLSKRKVVATNTKMTFWESLYLPAIFSGMATTISHLFKRKATIKYPDQKKEFSDIYRGKHVLKRDENGAERCTACGLCAVACPAEAITMIAEERKPNEKHLYREEKYASVYEIDMLRCIYCGLCEEACPKEAIFLTDEIVDAEYMRGNFVYGKDRLVEPKDQNVDVSKRQTENTIEFKKLKGLKHNKVYDKKKKEYI